MKDHPAPAISGVGCIAPKGKLMWFTTSNGVGHMSSGGAYATFASPSGNGSYTICLGPDGHIWSNEHQHRPLGERNLTLRNRGERDAGRAPLSEGGNCSAGLDGRLSRRRIEDQRSRVPMVEVEHPVEGAGECIE